MAVNNNYSCTMKNILRARDKAVLLMQRTIVNGSSTSLWYDPWINHMSLVDLLGWNKVML